MSKQRVYMASDANWVEQGQVVSERFQYEPYGQVAVAEGAGSDAEANAWHCLHEGLCSDGDTSPLHRFRNPDFSPRLGRWAQQDPMGYVDGMSLYEYVRSGPVDRRDPSGRQAEIEKYLKKETVKMGLDLLKAEPDEFVRRSGHFLDSVSNVDAAIKKTRKVAEFINDLWTAISSDSSRKREAAWESLVTREGPAVVKDAIEFAAKKAGSTLGGLYAAVAVEALQVGDAIGSYVTGVAKDAIVRRVGDAATTNADLKPGTLLLQEVNSNCALWVYKDNKRRIWIEVPKVYGLWGSVAIGLGLKTREYEWGIFKANGKGR